MITIKEMKEYLKQTAKEIREKKDQRKSVPYGYVEGLDNLRCQYRYNHIAYCIVRGTPIEKIEHDVDNIKSIWQYFVLPILNNIKKEVQDGE